jgi:hypothetical protein
MTSLGLVVRVAMGWCVIAACVHFSSTVRADESGLVTQARLVRSSTTSTINDRGDILGWGPAMAGDLAAATYDGIIGRVMRAMQDKVLRVLVRIRIACGWQWPHPLVVILVVQGLRVD